MTDRKPLSKRLTLYFTGLFIMALGVAISVKSDLGVTPISSVPYTATVVTGMDLGIATIIFSVVMVLLQIVILRKDYRKMDLLQLPIGIVFGLFLTFMDGLAQYVPDPSNFVVCFLLMLVSTVFVAFGVTLYVSAGLIPLAPEGFMIAVSRVTGKRFSSVKIVSDVTMVSISLITCLIFIHGLGSVGIGTVVAAILVGNEVRFFSRKLGDRLK